MIQILQALDRSSFCLIIPGFLVFIIWSVTDQFRMLRFAGSIKRGVKVWSRELPSASWTYLLNLNVDVVEHRKFLWSTYRAAFIRVQNGEAVIYCPSQVLHSSWVYVGYVDLNSPTHELEYRTSLPGILILVPFTILGILIFAINFAFQTRAIDTFLESRTKQELNPKGDQTPP